MALFGAPDQLRNQIADVPRFEAAFACIAECRSLGSELRRRLDALREGESLRIELGSGCHAMLMTNRTGSREAGRWETHRRHIDVQAVVVGRELMELADRSALVVSEDLSAERDAIFYMPRERGTVLRLDESAVAVYFPSDAHLGGIADGEPGVIRKVVVKVPVGP